MLTIDCNLLSSLSVKLPLAKINADFHYKIWLRDGRVPDRTEIFKRLSGDRGH